MSLLPERLSSLASFSWRERQYQLAVGLLAGNVFDWGAKEVALLMENRDLDFGDALSLIGPRPWLMDSLDEWIDTLENGKLGCLVSGCSSANRELLQRLLINARRSL